MNVFGQFCGPVSVLSNVEAQNFIVKIEMQNCFFFFLSKFSFREVNL